MGTVFFEKKYFSFFVVSLFCAFKKGIIVTFSFEGRKMENENFAENFALKTLKNNCAQTSWKEMCVETQWCHV
jgi:hypothetical protein